MTSTAIYQTGDKKTTLQIDTLTAPNKTRHAQYDKNTNAQKMFIKNNL